MLFLFQEPQSMRLIKENVDKAVSKRSSRFTLQKIETIQRVQ